RVPSFGFSVWSAILFLRSVFFSRAGPQGGFSTFRTSIGASESSPPGKRMLDTRSGGGIGQGEVYHIFPPQSHRQDSTSFGKYHPLRPSAADPPGLVKRTAAIGARIGGVDQQMNFARAGGSLNPVVAGDEIARARFHAEPVERVLPQRR